MVPGQEVGVHALTDTEWAEPLPGWLILALWLVLFHLGLRLIGTIAQLLPGAPHLQILHAFGVLGTKPSLRWVIGQLLALALAAGSVGALAGRRSVARLGVLGGLGIASLQCFEALQAMSRNALEVPVSGAAYLAVSLGIARAIWAPPPRAGSVASTGGG